MMFFTIQLGSAFMRQEVTEQSQFFNKSIQITTTRSQGSTLAKGPAQGTFPQILGNSSWLPGATGIILPRSESMERNNKHFWHSVSIVTRIQGGNIMFGRNLLFMGVLLSQAALGPGLIA